MSASLWSQGLQHARLLCPPLSLSLLKFMSIELVVLSNHLILCYPLLLLLSTLPSIRVFYDSETSYLMLNIWYSCVKIILFILYVAQWFPFSLPILPSPKSLFFGDTHWYHYFFKSFSSCYTTFREQLPSTSSSLSRCFPKKIKKKRCFPENDSFSP